MELIPSRTAVIVVHMQHDIVTAEGAFGGFFAAQAAERDIIGQAGKLLDAARRSGATAVYTIDTVLFAGVATNASVESTARQASDLGYHTVIVADACSAADPAAHDASIASLGLLAEITTTAEAVGALSGAAVRA